MQDYEKLGVFYLGRHYDLKKKKAKADLLLYESKHLVTHGLAVGMTGSGKTGLCFDIIEEAAIDGIPAILIDPKGDLANLLLTFPELRSEDFTPWVNEDEARKQGVSVADLAAQQAELWRKGLAALGPGRRTHRPIARGGGFCHLHAGQQRRLAHLHHEILRRATAGNHGGRGVAPRTRGLDGRRSARPRGHRSRSGEEP
jgi:hypothetical protein